VEEGGLRLGLSPQVWPGPWFSVAKIPLHPQVSTIRGRQSMPAWSPRPALALAAGAEGDDDDFGAIGPRGAAKDLGDPAPGVLGSCLGLAESCAVRAALNAPAPGPLSGRFGLRHPGRAFCRILYPQGRERAHLRPKPRRRCGYDGGGQSPDWHGLGFIVDGSMGMGRGLRRAPDGREVAQGAEPALGVTMPEVSTAWRADPSDERSQSR
jgi:hypothetical protein